MHFLKRISSKGSIFFRYCCDRRREKSSKVKEFWPLSFPLDRPQLAGYTVHL